VFGANASFSYDAGLNILYAPSIDVSSDINASTVNTSVINPTNILDFLSSTGSAGQLLSSTGTAIEWINPPSATVPAGSNTMIQFNDSGSFGASTGFEYNKTTGNFYVPTTIYSTNLVVNAIASFSINTNGIIPGVISDNTLSAGSSGQLLSSTGSAIKWVNPPTPVTPAGSIGNIQFNSGSSTFAADSVFTYFSATQSLQAPNVVCSGRITPTLIQDNGSGSGGLPSTGTSGQYLSATGSGIVWTNRPVPYADSRSGAGTFITSAPTSGTTPTVSFSALPRTSRYQLTANVVAYPTASNVTVTVEIWTRQVSGGAYSLSLTTTTFMNSTNVHLAFPAKSAYLNLTGGNILDIVVRTGANTGSGTVDPVNIDLLECTI
jgi:hypothetical protein